VRSPVWPVISKVLQTGPAPSERDQEVVDLLDEWVADDAPRLDANNDTRYDHQGPVIMDALWPAFGRAVLGWVLGDLTDDVGDVRSLSGPGQSVVDKDLRTLLGKKVEGRFNLRYCGRGDLRQCRNALWITVHAAADQLAARFGNPDPATWFGPAATTGFQPGLIPNRFRTTNRPTFQQVLEFENPWW
jgi:hypothetical protein